MENFNLGRMISKYVNYKPVNQHAKPAVNPMPSPASASQNQAPKTFATQAAQNLQMNSLESADRSVYIKDLMQLPKNMNELFYMLQKNINQMQFNRLFEQQLAARKNLLSPTQAQILAQLEGLNINDMQQTLKTQLSSQLQSSIKNLQLSSSQLINLADIANLIQINGKDAITKLILAMANASKQGVNDLTQLKETAKLINASIALASTDNPAQTLKTLMLLYLPWLPLQEGTGFDLEIETAQNSPESDSILILTITTVNFGIITATLILETPNSVQVMIECVEGFPKDELLMRIHSEEKHYSMQSMISFDTKSPRSSDEKPEVTTAKINMSHTNEISPYLLLMAHAIIRHTIEIDQAN